MNSSDNEGRQFIEDYLESISGRPKTEDLIARFVSDPTLAEHIRAAEAAFPAYELVAHQLIAEGDLVAMRGTFRGVHRGAFAGIEPTGKPVSANLMIIYRLDRGRIVEHWLQMDTTTLVQQLTDGAGLQPSGGLTDEANDLVGVR